MVLYYYYQNYGHTKITSRNTLLPILRPGGEVGMNDREKAIKGLEGIYRCVSPVTYTCGDCPYQDNRVGCKRRALSDAIALLKEREPKLITITTNVYGTKFYHCPNCKKIFYKPWELYKDYCYNCGQAVKWNE